MKKVGIFVFVVVMFVVIDCSCGTPLLGRRKGGNKNRAPAPCVDLKSNCKELAKKGACGMRNVQKECRDACNLCASDESASSEHVAPQATIINNYIQKEESNEDGTTPAAEAAY